MNSNQKVFEAITGFSASWVAMDASQDYDERSIEQIANVVVGTVENFDLIALDIDVDEVDVDLVAHAIFDFHACDTGCGIDLDHIFDSLNK